MPFALALTLDLPLGLWISECVVTRERWGRIPRSYIRCTLDRATTPAIQVLMIREAAIPCANILSDKMLRVANVSPPNEGGVPGLTCHIHF
ncbi:hypothetical protein [Stigmatella hybrida]|uniref:hypothetical protein n=1 Tax=Stigmatella hybrida TaxID=394097 RepID=UPI001CDB1AE4|nr:hypothetical protein [Stigmatella hybrida]